MHFASDLPLNSRLISDEYLAEKCSADWLSDPVQLAMWQDQLVNDCKQIREQLTEIHSELDSEVRPFGIVN